MQPFWRDISQTLHLRQQSLTERGVTERGATKQGVHVLFTLVVCVCVTSVCVCVNFPPPYLGDEDAVFLQQGLVTLAA